ncbi:hypothetical protein [Desulfonatronum parangueonense]
MPVSHDCIHFPGGHMAGTLNKVILVGRMEVTLELKYTGFF